MSISNLWMLGPVVVAAGQVNQITSYNPDPGISSLLQHSDGQVDPTFAAIMMQSPRLGFSTTAIARALGIAGMDGYAVAAAADFWFQKIAQGGARSGGSTSFKVTGTKGILVPTSIECSDGQAAVLNMDLVLISTDGTTAPIAITASQALPSITAADQVYVNGPVSINGTTLEGIKETKIDFGISLIVEHGSGEGFPTFVGIQTRQPSISFKTTDVTALSSSGPFFVAQGATDSLVYLRKVTQNAAGGVLRVADATTAHIKFSIDDGIIYARSIGGGSAKDPQMTEVMIEPTWDGTNNVIAISTASAIA